VISSACDSELALVDGRRLREFGTSEHSGDLASADIYEYSLHIAGYVPDQTRDFHQSQRCSSSFALFHIRSLKISTTRVALLSPFHQDSVGQKQHLREAHNLKVVFGKQKRH
jgi:hypothetical protein